jgi:hypothetical protein
MIGNRPIRTDASVGSRRRVSRRRRLQREPPTRGPTPGVFLHDMPDRARELNRLADISTGILYELGECIHAMPYSARAYDERTPLMHEIRSDGIDL